MEGLGGKQDRGARYKISKESIMNYIIKKKKCGHWTRTKSTNYHTVQTGQRLNDNTQEQFSLTVFCLPATVGTQGSE